MKSKGGKSFLPFTICKGGNFFRNTNTHGHTHTHTNTSAPRNTLCLQLCPFCEKKNFFHIANFTQARECWILQEGTAVHPSPRVYGSWKKFTNFWWTRKSRKQTTHHRAARKTDPVTSVRVGVSNCKPQTKTYSAYSIDIEMSIHRYQNVQTPMRCV